MIFGRFFADAKTRAKTIYALTDQRVLIVSGLWRRSIRSLELPGLSEINLFGTAGWSWYDHIRPSLAGLRHGGAGLAPSATAISASPSFDGIPQARDVLKKIRDAQRAYARSPNA